METEGVNTRVELAWPPLPCATGSTRHTSRRRHHRRPRDDRIDADAVLELDAVIHPFTVIRGASRGRGAEVGPHAVVVDSTIGEGALVGPFCYLRRVPSSRPREGWYVRELKNALIGERTKVPHLTYLGDADVGPDTNIAAGKHHRESGAHAGEGADDHRKQRQDGSRQYVRRPCLDRRDAWIAAGSVITEDVPPGCLGDRSGQAGQQGRRGGKRHD